MTEIEKAYSDWKNFVANREAARQEALKTGSPEYKQYIAKKAELEALKAEVAMLKLKVNASTSGYNKTLFDKEWALNKDQAKYALQCAVAVELRKGKKAIQVADMLGSRNLNFFYDVAKNLDSYAAEDVQDATQAEWEWSRFTGTLRYALAREPMAEWELELLGIDKADFNLVLLKGTIDSELEGQECIFNYTNGAFVSGSREVYESDTEMNRARRATTLAQILNGTYTGKVKEAEFNPYFEKETN